MRGAEQGSTHVLLSIVTHPIIFASLILVVVVCFVVVIHCCCHIVSSLSTCLHHCCVVVHCCGCLLWLWSSIVTATSCHHCLPVSIVVVWPLFCVVVNAKGEGEGATWQWLGALQWLFVVAVVVGVCKRLMTLVGGGGCRW